MLRVLAVVTAALLIAGTGLVHGIRGGRWSRSREVEQALRGLDRVPRNVGDWRGHDGELDPRQVEAANLAGYLLRRYENRRDGRVVRVILTCGRSGPVSVHTPDVCLPGRRLRADRPSLTLAAATGVRAPAAEFWVATFRKEAAAPLCQRVLWTWSADGSWQAPDRPRLVFARYSALYKLYLIHDVSSIDERPVDEDCDDFIQLLLPELDRALFAAS